MRSWLIVKIVVFTLMIVCFNGCSNSYEGDMIPRQVRRDIHQLGRMIENSSQELSVFRQKEKVTKAICSETNRVVRSACVKMLHEMYISLDISNLEYAKQEKAFLEVLHGPFGINEYGVTPEEIANRYLSWLSWLKEQLNRLGPKYRIDYNSLNDDNRKKYKEWNLAYHYILTAFEARMRIVEQILQKGLFMELPESERHVFIMKFEDIMGRPIRTKETIRRMKNVETPEEKAVMKWEVGPACFARDTDHPVVFPPLEVPACVMNVVESEVEVDFVSKPEQCKKGDE